MCITMINASYDIIRILIMLVITILPLRFDLGNLKSVKVAGYILVCVSNIFVPRFKTKVPFTQVKLWALNCNLAVEPLMKDNVSRNHVSKYWNNFLSEKDKSWRVSILQKCLSLEKLNFRLLFLDFSPFSSPISPYFFFFFFCTNSISINQNGAFGFIFTLFYLILLKFFSSVW